MLSYWIDVNVYGLCQGYFFIQDCQKMQYNGHSNVDGTMLKKIEEYRSYEKCLTIQFQKFIHAPTLINWIKVQWWKPY